jgi:hypothetical protein
MSDRREDLIDIRKQLFPRLERMRHIGDYGAGAPDIRETAEVLLRIIDHLLERTR